MDCIQNSIDIIAAEICRSENAKWLDIMDKCMLKAGSCPYCQKLATEQFQNENIEEFNIQPKLGKKYSRLLKSGE